MIITTQRSRAGYLFDLLLTAVGWFAFVYLFGSGIVAIPVSYTHLTLPTKA